MVKAIILVKSSKKLIAAKLGKIDQIFESFPVSGQFDAVVRIDVEDLIKIKEIATEIQKMVGVERTETMIEVNSN
ncbi:MAG: transcriptional regulator AsnC family [Cenarchaeum symbiont of Oopsacas minuta]|nr:transcriptional regulator AsnC family [Cenarchaeum symbiont of Oopsacas minuta]